MLQTIFRGNQRKPPPYTQVTGNTLTLPEPDLTQDSGQRQQVVSAKPLNHSTNEACNFDGYIFIFSTCFNFIKTFRDVPDLVCNLNRKGLKPNGHHMHVGHNYTIDKIRTSLTDKSTARYSLE